MPSEGIRQLRGSTAAGYDPAFRTTVQGRTVRIHLAGILDRAGVPRMIRAATAALNGRDLLVVLDGSGLTHLDYRCVPMLVRWSRGLRTYGHRVYLAGWSDYLKAILAMEDWDGELMDGSLDPARRLAAGSQRIIRVP